MAKRTRRVMAFCCVAAIAAVVAFLCLDRQVVPVEGETSSAWPRPVGIEEVRSSREESPNRYPVTVLASKEIPLSFRVGGPLSAVSAQPGDGVRRGEVLLEIDRRDFDDALRTLEAEREVASVALDQARLDLDRARPLLAEGVIAQAGFDSAQNAYDRASAALRGAESRLSGARHSREDCRLRAPFDGVVATRDVDVHQMVSAGQTVLTLLDLSRVDVRADIPEGEVAERSLAAGEEALVTFHSLPDRVFPVFLKEWKAAPDRTTGTYGVTFTLSPPPALRLLPGMTGELAWAEARGRGELTVPADAVVADDGGVPTVFVFDPATSTVSRRLIDVGACGGPDRLVIRGGLVEGERIVTAGAAFVVDGMAVRPRASR